MGEVKRYMAARGIIESDEGAFVLQLDYAALEAEREALRADLQATREALHEWDNRVGRLQDEVAKLNAACAAKDAALRVLDVESNSTLDSVVIAAALALDGGSNYIDASGAVEAEVPTVVQDNLDGTGTIKLSYRGVLSRVEAMIGKRVLIMLKPEAP